MFLSHHSHQPSKAHTIYTVAIIGFIYALHLVIPMYSNSSFLSLFADERTLGFIYMCGAAVSILSFLLAPVVIRRFGNYKTVLWLLAAQAVCVYLLATAGDPRVLASVFIISTGIIAAMGLCLDIFLEVYTSGTGIGSVRGLYTATLNASWVIGPLIGSMLIGDGNEFRNTYIAALAMVFPLFYLIYRNFPKFHDPNYLHLTPWQLARHLTHNKNWVWIFFANLVLQTFYAWMTVYSPIYLNKTVGFGWETIGIILTVMLLPFPLFQYPLGKLSDKRGEKGIMAAGFFVMGVATICLAFIHSTSAIVWAIALFATRVGAAAAEIMVETYFFKTVSTRDTEALGSFRITRPLAYFIAPLLTGFGLLFTMEENLFAIVGAVVLLALIPVWAIKDTA